MLAAKSASNCLPTDFAIQGYAKKDAHTVSTPSLSLANALNVTPVRPVSVAVGATHAPTVSLMKRMSAPSTLTVQLPIVSAIIAASTAALIFTATCTAVSSSSTATTIAVPFNSMVISPAAVTAPVSTVSLSISCSPTVLQQAKSLSAKLYTAIPSYIEELVLGNDGNIAN